MAVVRWGTEYATKDLLDRWLQVHGTDGFDKAEFEDVADEVLERLAVDPDSNLLIRADKASAPPGAEEFFRGSPHLLRLVTGAAMMQAEADAERDPEDEYDDGGFALTNRIAAQLMGRFTAAGPDQQTGRRGINILVKKGWLELITRGHPAISKDKSPTRQPVKGEPGRYRFANPTADEAKEVVPF